MSSRVIALAAVLAIAGACETTAGQPPPTVVIASDLPTSGAPAYTVALMHAIQLAIAQHPTIGGFRLVYMPLDDSLGQQPSATLGVQNVKHMIADPRVMGMIGPYTSYVLRDIIPRASLANLVIVSPATTDACATTAPFCTQKIAGLHEAGHINFFRLAAPDFKQGTAMGRFAAGSGIKRVAVLNESGDDGAVLIQHFEDELAATGGRVVFQQDLDSGTTDFTAFVDKAKVANAEAVYALGTASDGICKLGAQLRKNFAFLLVTDGAAPTEGCLNDTTDPATQVVGTYGDVDPRTHQDDAARRVVTAFATAYPNDKQLPGYTFAAYDCAVILIDAITRVIQGNGGTAPTRTQVLDAVAHGQFPETVTGPYAFDANGDAISPLMELWKVQDGHWTYVKRMDLSPKPV